MDKTRDLGGLISWYLDQLKPPGIQPDFPSSWWFISLDLKTFLGARPLLGFLLASQAKDKPCPVSDGSLCSWTPGLHWQMPWCIVRWL